MPKLRLLGHPALEGPDGPVEGPVNQRLKLALLARLAAARDHGVGRETLIAMLWPDAPASRARHSLSNTLYAIRQGLGEDAIAQRGGLLVLDTGPDRVDVWEFQHTLEEGRPEDAVDLYRGPFLEGIAPLNSAFERWADRERADLARLHEEALETLARSAQAERRTSDAVKWYGRLVAQRPLSARHTVGFIKALVRFGDEAGALQQAQLHAHLRRTELDAEPDPRIEAVAELIRSGRSQELDAESKPQAAPTDPIELGAGVSGQHESDRAWGLPVWRAQSDAHRPPNSSWAPTAPIRSIAVLPFDTVGEDPDDLRLACGLTEEATYALALCGVFSVVATTSTARFRGRHGVDVREIGRIVGAGAVVEGMVRCEEDRARIAVRLIDARTGYQLWSGRYDRSVKDTLDLEDEVARDIARKCRERLRGRILWRDPKASRALVLYERGRREMASLDESLLRSAIRSLNAALELDPDYPEALAALAEVCVMLTTGLTAKPLDLVRMARRAASRAIELEPSLPAANTSRGLVAAFYDWDPEHATRLLQRAIRLNPNGADGHAWFAFACAVYGLAPEDARRSLDSAKTLDPHGFRRRILAAITDRVNGRLDRARDRLTTLHPEAALSPIVHVLLAEVAILGGDAEESLAILSSVPEVPPALATVVRARCIAHPEACSGAGVTPTTPDIPDPPADIPNLPVELADLPVVRALVGACRGDGEATAKTARALEDALRIGDPTLVLALRDPSFAPLRAHSAFPEIVVRMGLEPERYGLDVSPEGG